MERLRQSFEGRPIVAGAGDLQSRVVEIQARECANHGIDPLVSLESPEVDERRLLRALRGIWRQCLRVNAVIDDADGISWDASTHEIFCRALTHCLKGDIA